MTCIVSACAAYCNVCDTEGIGKCDRDTTTIIGENSIIAKGCQNVFVWDATTKLCTGSK